MSFPIFSLGKTNVHILAVKRRSKSPIYTKPQNKILNLSPLRQDNATVVICRKTLLFLSVIINSSLIIITIKACLDI